jgi:hypothetical protein
MGIKFMLAIVMTMLLCPSMVSADIRTGQELITKLNSTSDTLETARDHLEATQFVGEILFAWEGKSHCKPPAVTVGQAAAVTQKFLNDNPALWHNEAAALVGAALGLAWPCPKSKQGKS